MLCFKTEKRFFASVFFISLVIKIVFFLIFLKINPCILMFDSEHYHKAALNILNRTGAHQFYRMPGYPLFMASCYKFFGVDTLPIILIQIFLSSFIPILIFMLTLTLFPKQIRLAKFASITSCFDLGYIIFPGLIMSESLFSIFFIIFLILFLYNYKPFFCKNNLELPDKHPTLRLFLAGLILGIACLFRPVGHALSLTLIFMILISTDNLKNKIKAIIALTAGLVCTLGIWIIRNFILTGYIFMHTLSGPHFLNHTAARLCMIQEKITYAQAQQKIYAEIKDLETKKINELGRPLQEIETCKIKEHLAVDYMLKNPPLTIRHYISNMLKTTFGLYSSELLFIDSGGQLPPYSNNRGIKTILKRFLFPEVNNKTIIAVIYFEIIFFLFLLIGFILFIFKSIFNRENLCVLIKIFPFLGCLIFITLACGFARLRLPIESFLIILASKEWDHLFFKRG